MQCPVCRGEILDKNSAYSCNNCTFYLKKKFAGKDITSDIARELFKNGRTGILKGFWSSKKKKEFSAALVVKEGKVTLEFPEKKNNKEYTGYNKKNNNTDNNIDVRIQSNNSGSVKLNITGKVKEEHDINYGLVPSRMAECLACITAVKLIKYKLNGASGTKIKLFLNNRDFTKYLLREKTPRDREMKECLSHVWKLLNTTDGWQAEYTPTKRPKLSGGPQADAFPTGIFPWLKAETYCNGQGTVVELPDEPDVKAQFTASVWKAKDEGNGKYSVPGPAQNVLKAWLAKVSQKNV